MTSILRKIRGFNTSLLKGDLRLKRILLSGSFTGFVKVSSMIINLITVPLTLSYLGVERFGLWMTFSSVLVLLNFSDLGISNVLINEIAKSDSMNDSDYAKKIISNTFFVLVLISTVVFFGYYILEDFINWQVIFSFSSDITLVECGKTFTVLMLVQCLRLPIALIQRIFTGYQIAYKFQFWHFLSLLISLVLLLLCINFKMGLPYLVATTASIPIIANVLAGFHLFIKIKPGLFPKFSYLNVQIIKNNFGNGYIFLLLSLIVVLGSSSDNMLISYLLDLSEVSKYEVIRKLFLASMIVSFFTSALWPAFSEAIESGDYYWIKNKFHNSLKVSLLVSFLIAVTLVAFGNVFVCKWVGCEFAASYKLLIGFALFTILGTVGGIFSSFLNNNRFIRTQFNILLVSTIIAILLKLILIPIIGISGAIWGTVISYSLFYVIPCYRICILNIEKLNTQN